MRRRTNSVARDSTERETQILAHAGELFSRGGYRETSLQEIAERVGITRQAFYYYYKSKDDLLWRLIGDVGDRLLKHARPIASSHLDPIDQLRALLEAHVRVLTTNRDAFQIYFAERHLVSKARDLQLKRGEDEYLGLIAAVIQEGQRRLEMKAGSSRLLALVANGIANSVLRWYAASGELSVDQISVIVAGIAVDGLRLNSQPAAPRSPRR